MVARLPQKFVTGIILWAISLLLAASEPSSLVRYSFDDQRIETGPDTFQIFEHAKGTVSLSSDFRFSGFQSVEIKDVAGDGDFPELQGYFIKHNKGELFIHFVFMVTDPDQPFNIALAGPKRFILKKNGIGLWLHSKDGDLFHVSDSIHKRLFPLQSFTWYMVDIVYNLDEGSYDLQIQQEHQEKALVELKSVANATQQKQSAVSVFSFIGDLQDKSDVNYYVDDIEINSKQAIRQDDFLAPGRRKLFVDYWHELQRISRKYPVCIPTTFYTDFGFKHDDILRDDTDLLAAIRSVIEAEDTKLNEKLWLQFTDQHKLQSIIAWRLGCKSLKLRQAQNALEWFSRAEEANSEARIIPISKALALAAAGRPHEADSLIYTLYSDWQDDSRFAAVEAMLGLAKEDLDGMDYNLEKAISTLSNKDGELVMELWRSGPDKALLARLQKSYPDHWQSHLRNRLLVEQYYYVLLWQERYSQAYDFARTTAAALNKKGLHSAHWLEYQANAAFLMGELDQALQLYERALTHAGDNSRIIHSIFKKMSDVFFRKGDVVQEQAYREFVFGTLR